MKLFFMNCFDCLFVLIIISFYNHANNDRYILWIEFMTGLLC